MKKKRIAILCLALIMVFSLCACSSNTSTTSTGVTTDTPEKTETTAGSENSTRVITDVLGRSVEIPTVINSVDCHGNAGRMMLYAGATDKITGVSELEIARDYDAKGLAPRPDANVNHEYYANCRATSSGWPKFETYNEEIVTLNPDIIINFTSDVASCDKLQEQVGIPVVGIYASSFLAQDFQDSLILLGDIMGTQEHVAEVISGLNGFIADLNERTKDIPDEDRPTVYAAAVGFRGYNGFEGTYADFPVFQAVNAKNVTDEVEETGAMLIDLEKIPVWDPEYIFIDNLPESLAIVMENYSTNQAFYTNLSAVKNNKMYTLPAYNWSGTNMEIALVDAYWVGSIIYPEQFADVDFSAKADDIFNLFLGQDYLSILNENGVGYYQYTLG